MVNQIKLFTSYPNSSLDCWTRLQKWLLSCTNTLLANYFDKAGMVKPSREFTRPFDLLLMHLVNYGLI